MSRLALLLAAAVLGTGCIAVMDDHHDSAPCIRTVGVSWTFEDADGVRPLSCATAGVTWVDVFVNGYPAGGFPCGAAFGTVEVAAGANELIVEGVDADGAIRYREFLPFDAGGACGSQGTVASMPGQGWVDVAYTFSPTNACWPTQPTHLWLEVWDDVAGQPAFLEQGLDAFTLCAVNGVQSYMVPVGSFTLLGIAEVRPVTGGTATVVRSDCTDRLFDVGYATVTTVQPVLVNSSLQCF